MDRAPTSAAERRALLASVGALLVLVLLQAPGRIVPETKLDVYLDPWRFLHRALSAWDASAGFGRVQNQAVGYLFPMGASSAVLHSLGVPPWLVQRLWIWFVASLALWGAHRVATAVGIRGAAGRLAAAWAYALAPATLSLAAFQSAGQLPYSVLPHVLAPLLVAGPGSSPRRTAARSTLWIVVMGGVNGASAFAVLGAVVVWFATCRPGPDRRRLAAWWGLGFVAATLWWLVPLAISVRYGIRFTAYTEHASITTVTESGTEVLRGTGNWLSYLTTEGGRWLPGAWAMASNRLAIVGSVLVAALGLAGLARRDAPGRRWLLPTFVLGTIAMGVGYAGPWGGGGSGLAQQLLDGPLVAFRNVHKFAALVRLPLALGLGHLVAVALSAARAPAPPRRKPALAGAAVGAVAVLAIVLAIAPAADRLTAPGSFEAVPPAWDQATAWLDAHEHEGRALLLPGSAFAEYRWGRPLDEPMGPLAHRPWAVRDLIPLGGNGSTRLLDGIDQALATDALPPGLVASLQRAGITHLVVRNDLALERTGGPRPATVRRLLADTDGLRLVASFGEVRQDPGVDGRLASPAGTPATQAFRDIDVYEVRTPRPKVPGTGRVATYPLAGTLVAGGGPEATLQLDPADLDGRALVLDVDVPPGTALPDPIRVATDTARRRDVEFGAIRDNATFTLEADQASPRTGDAPVDRWPADRPSGLTTAHLEGTARLTDSRPTGLLLPAEDQPFAAFDGNPATWWIPPNGGLDDHLDLAFDAPRTIPRIHVTLPPDRGLRVSELRVATDRGHVTAELAPGRTTAIALPEGATRHLRVTITDLDGIAAGEAPAISDIRLEGVRLRRGLRTVEPRGGAELLSLARARTDRFASGRGDEDGSLDRTFRWSATAPPAATLTGTATAAPGRTLDRLLASASPAARSGDIAVSASSTFRDEPTFGPANVLDANPTTAWVSARQARPPRLDLRWQGQVIIDNLKVTPLAGGAGAGVNQVARVSVLVGDQRYERTLDSTGSVAIPATATDHLALEFPRSPGAGRSPRRVAIAEVEVPALLGRSPVPVDRDVAVHLPCGRGPDIQIDGRPVATTATATVGQILDARAIRWRACAPVRLLPGVHRLTSGPSALVPSTARLGAPSLPDPGAAQAARPVRATTWGTEHRRVELGRGGATILATTENFNAGWSARFAGRTLTPIRVDGWRQGWIVPAGRAGTAELRYAPGASQRAGLVGGLAALVGLVALALVPARRRDDPWAPLEPRRWATAPVVALAVAAGLAISWPVALAAAPLAWAARRGRNLAPLAALCFTAAGTIALVQAGAAIGSGRGTFSGPAQALAALAVVAACCALVPSAGDGDEVSPGAGSTPSSRGPGDHPQPGSGTTPEGTG